MAATFATAIAAYGAQANAALISITGTNYIAATNTLTLGDTASGGVGYTYIDAGGVSKSISAKNVSGSNGVAVSGNGTFGVVNVSGITSSTLGNNSSDSFNIKAVPTSRGALSQQFTYTAKSGGTTEKTTITANTTAVAPQASITAPPVYLLAGSGATGTSAMTITNVGDGNLATNLSTNTTNLSAATNTRTLATGWTGSVANTGRLADANSTVASPVTSAVAGTLTYTAQSTRQTNIATFTTVVTNGSTDGRNTGQTIITPVVGASVAPQASVSSALSAGTIRAGTTAALSLAVQNTGDGNLAGADNGTTLLTNLRGSVAGSTGTFQGSGGAVNLTDTTGGQPAANASQTYSFTYAPTARGASSQTITTTLVNGADAANNAGTRTTTLSGTAVGPQFGASVSGANQSSGTIVNGGTILFGDAVNGLSLQHLLVSNLSDDSASKPLTDLTLTSISISGSSDFSFSLAGFNTKGATNGLISNTRNGGIAGDIAIQFATKAPVPSQAYLTIATDEGAALGGPGAIYVYSLVYTVPEPGTLLVLGVGMLGLAIARRNRRGKLEAVRLTAGNDRAT